MVCVAVDAAASRRSDSVRAAACAFASASATLVFSFARSTRQLLSAMVRSPANPSAETAISAKATARQPPITATMVSITAADPSCGPQRDPSSADRPARASASRRPP